MKKISILITVCLCSALFLFGCENNEKIQVNHEKQVFDLSIKVKITDIKQSQNNLWLIIKDDKKNQNSGYHRISITSNTIIENKNGDSVNLSDIKKGMTIQFFGSKQLEMNPPILVADFVLIH